MNDVYSLGQIVPLEFLVSDESTGSLANATAASISITKPDGTSVAPTLTNTDLGIYTLDYLAPAIGRYVAVFTATGLHAGSRVKVFDVQAVNASIVALTDVKTYMGVQNQDYSYSDAQIQSALDAERAAQARCCNVDEYGPDLREALFRRVVVNLAARSVPLAQFSSFESGGAVTRVTASDPVVKRLEQPYKRWVVL